MTSSDTDVSPSVSLSRRRRSLLMAFVLSGSALAACSIYDDSLRRGSISPQGGGAGTSANVSGTGGANDSTGGQAQAGSDDSGGSAGTPDGAIGDGGGAGSSGAEGGTANAGAANGGSEDPPSAGTGNLAGSSGGSVSNGGIAGTGGASGAVSSAGDGGFAAAGQGGSAPIVQTLAVGKSADASTTQLGTAPGQGNDNNAATRWCASSVAYPQWWRVDLGVTRNLTEVAVQFEHIDRTYVYKIETSRNNADFVLQASVSGMGALQRVPFATTVLARYVRITVTAAMPQDVGNPTWACFFEFWVSGN